MNAIAQTGIGLIASMKAQVKYMHEYNQALKKVAVLLKGFAGQMDKPAAKTLVSAYRLKQAVLNMYTTKN